MAEVGFYHLTRSTLVQVLSQLLGRTLAAGQRALIVGSDDATLDALSEALWADPAWLPHGRSSDGDPDLQPIWLSTIAERANYARFLFLVDGAPVEHAEDYTRIFDLFDGNDPHAVAAARMRWKLAKDSGHILQYWQQTDTGWQKSA